MTENNLNKIWANIESDLSLDFQETNKVALTKAINNLPVYSASDKIWKQG